MYSVHVDTIGLNIGLYMYFGGQNANNLLFGGLQPQNRTHFSRSREIPAKTKLLNNFLLVGLRNTSKSYNRKSGSLFKNQQFVLLYDAI